ncbi:hypothetical protein LINPERPRIM_LOCUS37137 [Linum perenne]
MFSNLASKSLLIPLKTLSLLEKVKISRLGSLHGRVSLQCI